VEIWNLGFMQYNKNEKGEYELLPQTNIDTGIGFERLVALLQGKKSAYETDIFSLIIEKIEQLSKKEYEKNKKQFRIISDHARSASFLISEGVRPSNLGQGYI
jgi:alanyl-tRNA synthetase